MTIKIGDLKHDLECLISELHELEERIAEAEKVYRVKYSDVLTEYKDDMSVSIVKDVAKGQYGVVTAKKEYERLKSRWSVIMKDIEIKQELLKLIGER